MYKKIVLKNGIQIGLYSMKDIKSVAIQASLFAGSSIENKLISGASHFIEHITLNSIKSHSNKKEFSEYMESLGISYNGYTNLDNISYVLDVPYINVLKSLKILKEIIFEPVFSEEVIDKERQIILDELIDKSNYPDVKFYYKCQKLRLKNNDHPLSLNIEDDIDVVKNIDYRKLFELYKKTFTPSNLYLSISGNFDIEVIENELEDLFGSIENENNFERPLFSLKDLSSREIESELDLKMNNIYTNISFPGFPIDISLNIRLARSVFSTTLTNLRSSRLFQKVREDEALVYDISSNWMETSGIGIFNISFEANSTNTHKTLEIIFTELEDIRKNLLSSKELIHCIKFLNNRTLLNFSTAWDINNWIMSYLFWGEEVTMPEDIIKMRSQLDMDNIKYIIDNIILYNNINIVSMGKLEEFNLNKLIKKINI